MGPLLPARFLLLTIGLFVLLLIHALPVTRCLLSICTCSASGRGGREMIERRYAAYSAASEKVVFYLWPGIWGLTAEAVLFTPMPAPRPGRTAHRSIPQD